MENFGYFFLGALITTLVSIFFYFRAGEELRRETKKLRELHELTLFALLNRQADLKPRYDSAGHIVGIIVELTARSTAMSSERATATISEPPPSS
ncbi:LapA family protein [Bradyrhizobium sp. CCBAU 53415]|uniref:LapA family protein n=1 Tax=Bradyrhizobium sp. CCBAU 53415 TaxID=1325119 RepID=UPI002305BFEE|nr:LapA family protein [Bradyrhizobium sp. CCBAU 53415]MDA9467032.1 hypothetical protein [Bradyrhizobium sp. CCBAU 53415]